LVLLIKFSFFRLSELRISLSDIIIDPSEISSETPVPLEEKDHYDHARTLLELREYDRFDNENINIM